MRYNFSLMKIALTKKTDNPKCYGETTRTGTLLHCWWECKMIRSPWKTIWQFLKILDMDLPNDPTIPLLGI